MSHVVYGEPLLPPKPKAPSREVLEAENRGLEARFAEINDLLKDNLGDYRAQELPSERLHRRHDRRE
jgi:hypothetical protein